MHPYVLIPLFAAVAAITGAASVWTRDPRNVGHRLLAGILAAAATWSLLEVIWNVQDSAEPVRWLIRLSSLAWMPLGPLCVHLFLELIGDDASWLRRRGVPLLYGLTAASIALYVATPWGIAAVHPTGWGWSFTPGPLFLALYAPTGLAVGLTLVALWPRLYPRSAPRSERRQGHLAWAGVAIPLLVASTTDVFLPVWDVHVPRLGSASLALLAGTLAWTAHHYGYSLMAPGTFSAEILATLRDGVALVRLDGRIRSVNRALARMCDVDADALVGDSLSDWLPELGIPTEERSEGVETRLRTRGGESVPVSVSTALLRDRVGEPVGCVLTVRDLREVLSLRSRLVMSGRLAAVGELAAGIAHEINNPVAYVQANLNQLVMHWEDAEKALETEVFHEGRDLLEECRTGVARVASIVEDVGGFAHTASEDWHLADPNELIENALRVARSQLRFRARVELALGPLPAVRCRSQELKQVFLNLILNASRAIEEQGTIRIATGEEDGFWWAEVADDGVGMTPEVRDRIFDPFFTTRDDGDGVGLGLALACQIVGQHGGEMSVDTAPGRGTCFRLVMPVAGRSPALPDAG